MPNKLKLRVMQKGLSFYNLIRHSDPHLPHQIFCEINTDCNRACWYCPTKFKTDVSAQMTRETYVKVLDDINDYGWRGILGFHLLAEPLKDKRIFDLIHAAKIRAPRAVPLLFTNGDYLTMEVAQKLIEAGLTRCTVTRHPPFNAKWDERINAIVNRYPNVFRHNIIEKPFNIAGSIEGVETKPEDIGPCVSPTIALPIRYDGSITVCCSDWERKVNFGNVNDQNIFDIWYSPKFVAVRKALRNRQKPYAMCNGCTAGRAV